MSECLCDAVPRARAGQVIGPKGNLVFLFHLDCPEHGIKRLGERPMLPAYKRAWVNVQQAMQLRGRDGAKLIEKAKDGRTALVEWIEWEFQPEEKETSEHGQGSAGDVVAAAAEGVPG